MDGYLQVNFNVLRFLAQYRTPILDFIFANITILAEEYTSIAVAIFMYWCISKKKANYLLIMEFMGLIVNQFLKIIVAIPRPWVIDPSFEIVEAARAMATGYSFPSAHTQVSFILYGGIAYLSDNRIVKLILYPITLLIAFSRMYLGVHFPHDVMCSLIVGIVFLQLFKGLYTKQSKKTNIIYWSISVAVAVIYVFFAKSEYNDALLRNIDAEEFSNYTTALEAGYKMLGASFGAVVNAILPEKYTEFEIKVPILKRALKFIVGLTIVLGLQKLTKTPLLSLFGAFGDTVRYFILVMVFTTIWPVIFDKLFNKKK